MAFKLSLIVLAALFCAGCVDRNDIYRGMYDAMNSPLLHSHSAVEDLPSEPPVSYDTYKSERDKTLRGCDDEYPPSKMGNEPREGGGTVRVEQNPRPVNPQQRTGHGKRAKGSFQ